MIRSHHTCSSLAKSLLKNQRSQYSFRLNHHGLVSRSFSSGSSLLGHSPMAPHIPSNSNADPSQIPTAKDVTTSGGVWAPSSAKREKLKELQGELAEYKDVSKNLTLDSLATEEERLDLYLADGLSAIVSTVEQSAVDIDTHDNDNNLPLIVRGISELLPAAEQLDQSQWEATLTRISRLLEERLSALPSDRCFKDVRDFYMPHVAAVDGVDEGNAAAEQPSDPSTVHEHAHAQEAILRFRVLLALAVVDHLKKSWKDLTTLSDQDVDRAAVTGTVVDKQAATINAGQLQKVITAYLTTDCTQRTEAMWNLMDRDGDGLLDETEMNQVCQLAVEPVRIAMIRMFKEALDASPVRAASFINTETSDSTSGRENMVPPKRIGWRQRRREAKEMKKLSKLFRHTLQAHFVDEVEMPHRMRCIYAWANKKHQDNKIDSVLVDDAGWSGRKRFVELYVERNICCCASSSHRR
jgi:hypothetical protein